MIHICINSKTPQFCMPLGKPEVSPSTGNLCHHSQHFQSRWGWGFPSPHFYRKIQPRGSITMKKKQRKVPKQPQQSFKNAVFSLLLLSGPTSEATPRHTMEWHHFLNLFRVSLNSLMNVTQISRENVSAWKYATPILHTVQLCVLQSFFPCWKAKRHRNPLLHSL